MTVELLLSITALVLAAIAITVSVLLLRRAQRAEATVRDVVAAAASPESAESALRPAFIINPSKNGAAELRALAELACSTRGITDPLWLETTEDDPGTGQAQQALDEGASVVIACGGDGTVRQVAGVLAGSGTPMGLIPIGTGNLYARNLDLPLEDTAALIDTALDGLEHPVDLGWLRVDRSPDDHPEAAEVGSEHPFLVIAGLGFDANMVADTDERLKKVVGWLAYFWGAVPHLTEKRLRVRLTIGEGEVHRLQVRSLMIANCGRLPGGLVLVPDAEIDDGYLDVAAVDTKVGLVGWASLAGTVALQRFGFRRRWEASPGRISFWRGKDVRVHAAQDVYVQVDGDLLGVATTISTRTDARALLLRTAEPPKKSLTPRAERRAARVRERADEPN